MTRTTSPTAEAAGPAPAGRAGYLVLGMHRSGTSAATQVLALAGADLPQNVMPGDEYNAKGYFEPWRIAIFNDQRLRAAGGAWDDPFAFPYRPLEPREERRWVTRATDLFDEEYGAARYPLMKDPRVSVLLPLWLTALAELSFAPRVVIPVRHPLEVAGSLAKRNGFPPEKSVLLWAAYMLAAEAGSRGLPRAFVSYEGLLADWRGQVERIESGHGARLPKLDARAEKAIDGFLTSELRHNAPVGRLAETPVSGPLAARVFEWFEAAARGEAPPTDVLDTVALQFAELSKAMSAFVSPVTCALDLARSDLLEARQRAEFEEGRAGALDAEVRALQAAREAEAEQARTLMAAAERELDEILGDN
ncbi:hypothetical protein [Phenylobacterium sp.]|uniref:sulfotransferase family protein n=1 Tax=Phenylobacterium sp. TaxID=1871053 RepID=UPI0019AB697C|nr:hypothetical protein [Phenylobacterium sp.]MBC7167448.1 hypothetical protein [Phenylobacterium sp.]